MTNRTFSFFIKNRLEPSIKELVDYLNENNSSIDIYEEKKKYVIVNPNGIDINRVLSNFLIFVIEDNLQSDEIPDDIDIDTAITENIDIFYELTDQENESILIEVSSID